jgi:hypothetical protein
VSGVRRRARAGAPFLPYLITDRVVAPEACRKCYSENLALMPNCYFVNDYKRAHMVRHWALSVSCVGAAWPSSSPSELVMWWTATAHGGVCAFGPGEEASPVCFTAHTQPCGVCPNF